MSLFLPVLNSGNLRQHEVRDGAAPEYLTLAEAAELLRIGERTCYDLRA